MPLSFDPPSSIHQLPSPSSMPLRVVGALPKSEYARCESIPFVVTITNAERVLLPSMPDPTSKHEGLRVTLLGPLGTRTADAGSADYREGKLRHHLGGHDSVSIGALGSIEARVDLLRWFGEIEPGDYTVRASYPNGDQAVDSAPVSLRVRVASPRLLAGAQPLSYPEDAPLIVASYGADAAGEAILVESRSAILPPSPVAAVRFAAQSGVAAVFPAAAGSATPDRVPVLWTDARGKLLFSSLPLDLSTPPGAAASVEVKTSFAGRPVPSPFTSPDGTVWCVYMGEKDDRLAALRIGADGLVMEKAIDTRMPKIGALASVSDGEDALHVAWAAPGGREVMIWSVDLGDPTNPAAPRLFHTADAPVLAIGLYLDTDGAPDDVPVIEQKLKPDEPPPSSGVPRPRLAAWLATVKGGRLVLRRVDPVVGSVKDEANLDVEKLGALRVVSTVVRRDQSWSLLLASPSNTLHHASSALKSIRPLAEAAGQSITAMQQPHLVRAGARSGEPWVFVRFISASGQSIEWAALEPVGVPLPGTRRGDLDKPDPDEE